MIRVDRWRWATSLGVAVGRVPLRSGTDRSRKRQLPLVLRQRFCDLTRGVDEKLRGRAQRAVLQGDDSDLNARQGQVDGQDLQLRDAWWETCNADVEKIVRKRPDDSRLMRTSGTTAKTVVRG